LLKCLCSKKIIIDCISYFDIFLCKEVTNAIYSSVFGRNPNRTLAVTAHPLANFRGFSQLLQPSVEIHSQSHFASNIKLVVVTILPSAIHPMSFPQLKTHKRIK